MEIGAGDASEVKIWLEYSRVPMQDAPKRYENGKGAMSDLPRRSEAKYWFYGVIGKLYDSDIIVVKKMTPLYLRSGFKRSNVQASNFQG